MRVKTTENDNSTSAIAFVRNSGSDKFAVFSTVGRVTKGHVHVKTAGTSWLEAMRVVAEADPDLYRKAHTLIRDEYRYHQQLAYGVDLSNVADHDDSDHLVDRMYYLIQQLDTDEQMLITEYLKHGNMLKVAKSLGLNYLKVTRRMSYIKEKLVRLDQALGDNFDIQALDADGILYDDPI